MPILTVGPTATYASIAAAMLVAGPGDTIQLQSGFSNETATVTHSGMIVTGDATSLGIVLQLGLGIPTFTAGGTAPFAILDASDGNGIVGNAGDNLITVTAGVDAVDGGAGVDRLVVDYHLAIGAITGNSTSNFSEAGGGGRSVTITDGTIENFTVLTGAGADTITVGDGTNIINVAAGANTVTTGNGNNLVTGGDDADTITTGAGNDTIHAGAGTNTVSAGQGANIVIGGSGADTLTALDGGNYIDGGDGTNILTSGAGNDTILSGTGADSIVAGAGDDVITARGGADTIDAGAGNDRLIVDYSAMTTNVTGGVVSGNLGAGYVGHLADQVTSTIDFQGVENFTITTGTGNDLITTGDGNDAIATGAGIDTISAGAGNNTIDGGAGIDTVTYAWYAGTVLASLASGTVARGDGGVDSLTSIETYIGGSGNDTIVAAAGSVSIDGGGGSNRLDLSSLALGVTVDLVHGTVSNGLAIARIQDVVGTSGNDVLIGDAGPNWLNGGAGNDTVVLSGPLSAYSFTRHGEPELTSTGPDGHDRLSNIENLRFDDGTVSLTGGNRLVDPIYYDKHNADVFAAGIDPSTHYASYGWHEGRNPNAFFSNAGYGAAYADVRAQGINPLDHYDTYGWHELRDPSALFDTRLYLIFNPDVAAALIDPLMHYVQYGAFEGRKIAPAVSTSITAGFDPLYYKLANVDVGNAGIDPSAHYNQYGWHEGRNPDAFFDTNYYLTHNADVAAAGINPFQHYMTYGWKEHRDADPHFNADQYLAHYADVAAAGINPLQHFLQYGLGEGRSGFGDLI